MAALVQMFHTYEFDHMSSMGNNWCECPPALGHASVDILDLIIKSVCKTTN